MPPSLALALPCIVPFCQASDEPEPSLEERRLAVIPADLSLEGPTMRVEGKEWKLVRSVAWSADGQRVAYVGHKGGKEYPVVGETVYDGYHYVSGPTLSANGALVVFRAGNRDGKKSETWWVLANGEKLGKEDWIGEIGVSPDDRSSS
jgi:hypothetical protein